MKKQGRRSRKGVIDPFGKPSDDGNHFDHGGPFSDGIPFDDRKPFVDGLRGTRGETGNDFFLRSSSLVSALGEWRLGPFTRRDATLPF